MSQTKTPSPLMFNVETANLLPKNVAGIGTDPEITKASDENLQATERLVKSLEERYANPNYFKVASGFLKPQLGGFFASLGSASEALGEGIEQQRAIAPTIEKMRADIATQRVGLSQKTSADRLLQEAIKKPGGLTSEDVAKIEKLDPDTGKIAQQKFTNQSSSFNDMLKAWSEGATYTQLVKDYGQSFVDRFYPALQQYVPGKGSGTVPAAGTNKPTTPNANASASTTPLDGTKVAGAPEIPQAEPEVPKNRPLGVPENMLANVTKAQDIAALNIGIEQRAKAAQEISERYRVQSETSIPVFETTKALYTLASPNFMKPAFAVFEKGDPLGVIGTALEAQNVSAVLQKMREQIVNARMNSSDTKAAMSNLNVMESVLSELQTKMQNNVVNPTDIRTLFEAKSVPGMKNTQDAFLRRTADIGSTALSRYEQRTVLNQFLKRPTADINDWEDSPEYKALRKHIESRSKNLLTSEASNELPRFMKQGLDDSFRYSTQRPTSSGKRLSTADLRRLANERP
jgi:hypothetical protein